MDELQENCSNFVRQTRDALAGVLAKYGFQLVGVSLTALEQTPLAALDENNTLVDVGMRKLAEVFAKSKKERAEIRGEGRVQVRRAEVEANRLKIEIELEERRSEIAQTQQIGVMLAWQLPEFTRREAEIARNRAPAMKEEAEALEAAGPAEAEADKARIEAENSRSEATVALECGKVRLAAMPEVLGQ